MDIGCSMDILKLIFPDGIPDSWVDNPTFTNHLNKLGQYNLEKLSKELDHLSIEKAGILNQTQDLAFSNYKTFIQTAECSRELFQQFQKTESSLDSLLEGVPKFVNECEEFMKKCGEIKVKRQVNSISLLKHGSILQLLEVPQLMDTVVQEGLYDDALRLASFVRRIAKTHQNIPVIQSLLIEIEQCWIGLMEKLIMELHSELQLPRCLQVVGVLRRMGILSELDLRLKFLQARDSWFSSVLKQINKEEPQHLNKIIDVYRTHMFNIITQYTVVFPEQENSLTTNTQHFNDYSILQEWINNKVNEFVAVLEKELSSCNDAVGCLEQVMYFGQSLGRVGSDLRALVAPVFVKRLTQALISQIQEATLQFTCDMNKFSLESSLNKVQTLPQLNEPQSDVSPPLDLSLYYPLGRYANSLASCFNQLKLCAPLCIAQPFTRLLEQALTTVATTIAQFYRREQQAMTKEEMDLLSKMVVCFNECFVPYVQRCLHLLFSPVEIATFLSVPVYKLQEQKLTFFDMDHISAPINHLLPVTKIDIAAIVMNQKKEDAAKIDSKSESIAEDENQTDKEIKVS
ncbi:conserved oligomeric Golgi complex subunit 8 [Cimex lectularius]|uniref:Conserved oligomeric Golgi complex subunit 8 n=1 Tax=Cimex lectularius TaxID=79782 RepID=A0A8I6S685_CIMLE|nr:conserved oligomeric Golgi complex subunit 8 [Cimex lectularius]